MIGIEILLTFVYFLECTVVQCKDALSIYWNRNGHECSRIWKLSANFTLIQCIKIVSSFLGRNISGTTFFWAEIYRRRLLTFITGSSSRLLRLWFSADLTMHWFPLCHFRCMKFKPLVIWIWNQNIAISTIVGTSSHITNKINESQNDCMQSTSSSSWCIALMAWCKIEWRECRKYQIWKQLMQVINALSYLINMKQALPGKLAKLITN